MSQDHDAIDPVPTEVDDLDVEGHGMKEVALGLSAASLVTAGGGVALASGEAPAGGTGARGVAAQQLAEGARGDLRGDVATAKRVADRAVQRGTGVVTPIGTQAQGALAHVVTYAGSTAGTMSGAVSATAHTVVSDPMGSTDAAVDRAMRDARVLRDSTIGTAGSAAAGGVKLVGATATGAQATAQAAAGQLAERAGEAAESTAERAAQATGSTMTTAKEVLAEDAGASVERSDGTTTATVTAGGHAIEVSTR